MWALLIGWLTLTVSLMVISCHLQSQVRQYLQAMAQPNLTSLSIYRRRARLMAVTTVFLSESFMLPMAICVWLLPGAPGLIRLVMTLLAMIPLLQLYLGLMVPTSTWLETHWDVYRKEQLAIMDYWAKVLYH